MSPIWNHIFGLICVEIGKIVGTWKLAKLAKTNYPDGDLIQGPILCLHSSWSPSTIPPPPSVAIFFIYQTRIGYIWIHALCRMYELLGHRGYKYILFNVRIHIWRRDVWCDSLWRHLTHQHSISSLPGWVRLPWTVRVHLAAQPVRVRSAAPIS